MGYTHGTTVDSKTRICTKCNAEYPNTNEYFSYANKRIGRLNAVCKNCQAIINKEKRLKIIEQNKEKLICIAEALLEHETLSGEDIESLYNTGKMLEHHDGTLTEEPVQEVKEEKPSIDDQDDYLDENEIKRISLFFI